MIRSLLAVLLCIILLLRQGWALTKEEREDLSQECLRYKLTKGTFRLQRPGQCAQTTCHVGSRSTGVGRREKKVIESAEITECAAEDSEIPTDCVMSKEDLTKTFPSCCGDMMCPGLEPTTPRPEHRKLYMLPPLTP